MTARLDQKMIDTFQSGYKLNYDQLVYMHHNQNLLDKNQTISFQQKIGAHKVTHHRVVGDGCI